MTTDFRALCVELTDCLEKSDWPRQYKPVFEQWIYIARKALAEPEPEGPTDEELLQLDTLNADLGMHGLGCDLSQIRRALELLPD